MNKKNSKIFLLLLITFVIISSLAMLLKEKNTKINNKHLKLNYELSYEEAFPDKEFRRLILSMLYKHSEERWGEREDREIYGDLYSALKITGDAANSGITSAITDEELERYSKQKIDKNFLDKVLVLHPNSEVKNYQNIINLTGIEYLKNVKRIVIANSKIKEADFSQNQKLETLFLTEKFHSTYQILDIEGTSILEKVNIKSNENLKHLILNFNPNKENTVDLSGNPNLEALYIIKSNLKEIDLTHNPNLNSSDINLQGNKLQSIKANSPSENFRYGASEQKITVEVDQGVPIRIPLKFNDTESYLEGTGFTRENDVYTFNQVGTHTYNFYNRQRDYSGTVEVTVTGGEAKNFTPLITNDSRCYVNERCSLADKIYNIPRDANIVSVTSCDHGNATGIILVPNQKGLGTCDVKITFGDGSTKTYKVKIPVFEKNIKEIEPFKPIYPKSKYIEGEFAKNLLLSYSEVQDERDDYLNILNKKSKCNYETYICDTISYKIEAFYRSIGDKAVSDKPIPGKAYDYFSVNNTAILDSKVKVYNSKQMEQVVRNYLNGSSLIDWQGDENQKVFYIYNQWLNGVPNILETTILRDTDGDKIPDVDDEDDDNDGVSDEQEIIDGTNPKDASSFKVTKICYKVKG